MRLVVGDKGEGLSLAARAGRGGNANRRKHRLGGFSEAHVIRHRAAVGEQEINPFGAVH